MAKYIAFHYEKHNALRLYYLYSFLSDSETHPIVISVALGHGDTVLSETFPSLWTTLACLSETFLSLWTTLACLGYLGRAVPIVQSL